MHQFFYHLLDWEVEDFKQIWFQWLLVFTSTAIVVYKGVKVNKAQNWFHLLERVGELLHPLSLLELTLPSWSFRK